MQLRRPNLLVLIVTVAFVLGTVRLGFWQLGRGRTKVALAQQQASLDRVTAGAWHGEVGPQAWQRRFVVRGQWVPQGQILLDNRIHDGKAGYYVLAPLRLDDGRLLTVFRGWLARAAGGLPALAPLPTGEIQLLVRLAPPEQHFVQLAPDAAGGVVWQNLDWARYRALVRQPLIDAVAYQQDGDDGLVHDWPAADIGADRHFAYAGQWFLFAATALVLFFYFHLKRSPT